MKPQYVISDIHLCGKKGDELGMAGRRALAAFLAPLPDRSVILNGDILDLLRASLAEIEKDDEEFLALLFRKAHTYVAGNHDREALSFMDGKYRGVPVVEKLIIGDTLFMHGDAFDPVNQKGQVFGNVITRIVDWLADRVPGVMKQARKLERWAKKVGRFGGPEKYRALAFDHIEHMQVEGSRIKQIILGHTHKRDRAIKGNMTYNNCGTWINGKRDFVKLTTG